MGRAHHPSLQRESLEVTARMRAAITGDQSTASDCPDAELRSPSRSRPPARWSAASPGCTYCGHAGTQAGSPPGSRSSRPALGTSCAPVRSGPAIDARAQARHYRGQDRVRLAPHRAAHPGIDPGCCQIPAGRSEPPSAVAVGKSRSAWCCTAKLPASMSFMPARSVEHGSASGSAFASRTHPQLFAAANPGLQAS
jgi:hypothetical protein